MGNNLFKILSSDTRLSILKLLSHNELHLSELSRQLHLSKAVVSRHITILENADLVKRRILGNMHFLHTNLSQIEKSLEEFSEHTSLHLKQGQSIFSALKQLPNINIQQVGESQFISAIDGEQGHYIYLVDGETPNVPINDYQIKKDTNVSLKKIVFIEKKNIKIKVDK